MESEGISIVNNGNDFDEWVPLGEMEISIRLPTLDRRNAAELNDGDHVIIHQIGLTVSLLNRVE